MKQLNVLIACEESQEVCKAFRELGHNAFSCDIEPCSGGFPEWHIHFDVRKVLYGKCYFATQSNHIYKIDNWDLIIAHPPCTYLTNTGNRWFNISKYGDKAIERFKNREEAINFFMIFTFLNCKHVAIENPIGCMSTVYNKPNQIIQPFMFGDCERKSTCLWLKNLPNLIPTNIVEPNIINYKNGKGTDSPWHVYTMNLSPKERSKMRSKTFPGIAHAMADQWSDYILKEVIL